MKTRRTKRKMATRKKVSRVQAVVVRERAPISTNRVALVARPKKIELRRSMGVRAGAGSEQLHQNQPRYQLFIGGKFVAPRSGKYFGSINPATEEKLAEIADANRRDVDLASSPLGAPTTTSGARCPDASGENTSIGSRA